MAGHTLSHAIKYRVEIEGMKFLSMKHATLAYTGCYDDSIYRKIKRENNLSVIDALHERCNNRLLIRLDRYKRKKQKKRQPLIDAAIRVIKQIDRLDRALTARTSLLSSPIMYCRDCGVSLGHIINRRTKTCGECIEIKQREWRRENNKNKDHGKHIKRARKRGADYIAGITAKSVAIRDCMICQICGVRVEQHAGGHQLKGWTVGHILAIAKGGAHTWDNVQCECSACNTSKGLIDDAAYKANKTPFNPEIKKAIVAFMDRSASNIHDETDQIIEQYDMWG